MKINIQPHKYTPCEKVKRSKWLKGSQFMLGWIRRREMLTSFETTGGSERGTKRIDSIGSKEEKREENCNGAASRILIRISISSD